MQLDLLNPPRARATDVSTSHAAADHIQSSGIGKYQQDQVLDALKRFPNRTGAELARDSGLERYMVSRRLSELFKGGRAYRNPLVKRDCTVTKRKAMVWRVV